MPRSSRAQSEVLSRRAAKPVKGVIASGRTLSPKKADPTKRFKAKDSEKWQEVVWEFYDSVGEYRYSVNWIANTISRARLTVMDQRDGKEVTEGPAFNALKGLYGGPEYQKEMLRQLGIHFTTAGDCYLVGASGILDTDPDTWDIIAASELKRDGANGNWKDGDRALGSDALVIRLWRPHPRHNQKADSPSRAVLPILAEIDGLTRHVSASIDSRLASAGVLLVPSEINFSTTQTQHGPTDTEEEEAVQSAEQSANDLAQQFIDVANEAINDRESAAALTPIVIQASGEYLKAIKFVTFSTPLDEKAKSLRDEAIRRLALGMDMPPEILTGTGDLSHWNAWSVEDAAIKAHAEPMLAILCSSLTESYLVDYLEGEGMSPEEAANFVISVDTSEMRLRPNRSKEAIELYNLQELSGAALRRENGFAESDAPDAEEIARLVVKKLASGSPSPEVVQAAATLLGVKLEVPEPADGSAPRGEENVTPSTEDHPTQDPPEQQDAAAVAIAAAGEMLMFRALERAGQRLRNRSREDQRAAAGYGIRDLYRHLEFSATDVDELLDGAWDALEVCSLDYPKQHLAAMLQRYAVRLLATRQAFDTYTFRTYIEAELVLAPASLIPA